MLKSSFLTLLLAGFASPVWAVAFNAGLNQTMGDKSHQGTNVYAAIGMGGWSLSPEYKTYTEEFTNGGGNKQSLRFHTVQARLGYDMRWFGFGATGGTTLKEEGYSSLFGGADFAFTLSPMGDTHIRRIGGSARGGAPVGKGVARVDFGGGAMATEHKQEVSTSFLGYTQETKATQTELHGFVGASVLKILVSGRFSKFLYDQKLKDRSNTPTGFWTPLAGHLSYASAFADTSLNLRVEAPVFPMIAPYASYTVTKYAELATGRPGDTRALTIGAAIGLQMLALYPTYQHVSVTAGEDRDYYGVTAGLRL